MLQVKIAGLTFCIEEENRNNFKRLTPFETVFTEKPDIEIKFRFSGSFAERNYTSLEYDGISWNVEHRQDGIQASVFIKGTNRTEYVIETGHDWSDITIFHRVRTKRAEQAFCDFLGNFIISNKIIQHNGFVLHASSISHEGKGIVFTAPSRTGKSTHAALWKKYYNASILNDDCPVIKIESGKAIVHGTPWSGSKNKAMQASSPLSAIVFLEQAGQNTIRELTNKEAIPMFLPRVFLPYQNPILMDTVMQNIENAIESVPKYLLRCRADREAAELVYQCIK
jgi:hypothetical protein